jgi:hypothetical protein
MKEPRRNTHVQYAKCPNEAHWILFDLATQVHNEAQCKGCIPGRLVTVGKVMKGWVSSLESDKGWTPVEPAEQSDDQTDWIGGPD